MNPTRTLVIYQTRSGTTKKATDLLVEKLKGEVTVINLKKEKAPALDKFDRVIIGGSIRASMMQSGLKKYIEKNLAELKSKEIGLYLCCMEEGETARKQFDDSFSEEIRSVAKASGLFGGEFNFDNLNFLEKGIIKKVAGVTESVFRINYEAIDKFAEDINS